MRKQLYLFPLSIIASLAYGLVNLGIIFFIRDTFSFTPSITGWFAATFSLAYFAGCYVVGPSSRLLRPWASISIGSAGMGVTILLIYLLRQPALAFILYALYGLVMAFFWPPLMGWVSEGAEGKKLGQSMSSFNLSWSAGMIIGPYVAGYLSEMNSSMPLFVGAGIYLLCSVLIVLAFRFVGTTQRGDSSAQPPHGQHNPDDDLHTGLPVGLLMRIRVTSWSALFCTYVFLGIASSVFPVFARSQLGLTESSIGLILLSRALFTTVGFLLLGKISAWHFKRWTLAAVQGAYLILFSLFISANRLPNFLILMAIYGLVFSFTYTSSIFHGVAGSTNRAGRMGIHESILTLGLAVGAIVGGWILQAYGMPTVYRFALSVTGLGTVAGMVILYLPHHFDKMRKTE